ncbi:MAG: carboxymuconolactone decarboxylase family protein [Hyphomicrobium sp.]|jgi:AhpD family alkylhydroperoxidase|nr:carboxymuconolactone decarboxylase family protein [Hyphomicrobium sp.]
MIMDWQDYMKQLSPHLRELRVGTPDVMKSFSAMAQASLKTNALDTKTKELIALAIGVATRCDDCIAFHTKAAIDQGATREEVMETLGLAIYMGAGPSVMYASHAVEAFDQIKAAKDAAKAVAPAED